MLSPASRAKDQTPIAGVLDRNIHAIINSRKAEEKKIGWQDRIAQRITGFVGTLRFVFLHLFVFGCWISANLGPVRALRFDPNFSVLDILVSIEAIFLSTFVLINQNRMAKLDARRADLDLQVSLLAEHEITHLVTLVTAIASKMNLEHAKNPVLDELKQEIKPEQILAEIEIRQEKADQIERDEG
jgi:uncharacterized membrane protein